MLFSLPGKTLQEQMDNTAPYVMQHLPSTFHVLRWEKQVGM